MAVVEKKKRGKIRKQKKIDGKKPVYKYATAVYCLKNYAICTKKKKKYFFREIKRFGTKEKRLNRSEERGEEHGLCLQLSEEDVNERSGGRMVDVSLIAWNLGERKGAEISGILLTSWGIRL